jgi:F-type H+-transporting ATPase subunit alpha
VDVGISVSRVGSSAQIKAMKKAVGTLKSDLQQFRDLEAFAAFGSDLDAASKAQLERGYRLTELLKQGINSPMSVEEQCVVLFAATRGYLDNIDISDVAGYEASLIEWFRTRHSDALEGIRSSGDIADVDGFEAAIKAFTDQFEGAVADGSAPEIEAMAQAEASLQRAPIHLPEVETVRPDSADTELR